MNPNETEITGMIGVCTGNNGCARLDYRIDLKTNKVQYILMVYCKVSYAQNHPDAQDGNLVFQTYEHAKAAYDAVCKDVDDGKAVAR